MTSALMIWKSLILVTGSESPASAACSVPITHSAGKVGMTAYDHVL